MSTCVVISDYRIEKKRINDPTRNFILNWANQSQTFWTSFDKLTTVRQSAVNSILNNTCTSKMEVLKIHVRQFSDCRRDVHTHLEPICHSDKKCKNTYLRKLVIEISKLFLVDLCYIIRNFRLARCFIFLTMTEFQTITHTWRQKRDQKNSRIQHSEVQWIETSFIRQKVWHPSRLLEIRF